MQGPPTKHFASDADHAEFYRGFVAIALEPDQLRFINSGLLPPVSKREAPYVEALHNILRPYLELTLEAFNLYYGWSDEQRHNAFCFCPMALRAALRLTKPEIVDKVREMRRKDVYPTLWPLLLLENFKFLLLVINDVGVTVLDSYEEFDDVGDSTFRQQFEYEWHRVMRFRDAYSGFLVHPKTGVVQIVRYLSTPIHNYSDVYLLTRCRIVVV